MASSANWTWSQPHGDYYYVTYDGNGQPVYIWSKQQDANAGAQQFNDPGYQSSGQSYQPPSQSPTFEQYQSTSVSQAQQYGYASPQSGYAPSGYGSGQSAYTSSQSQQMSPYMHTRGDSASYAALPDSNADQMPPPIPSHLRPQLPNLIPGTPHRGWYENLDNSYRMRTGFEAHQFFKKGRVFAVLWSEGASETAVKQTSGTEGADGTVKAFNDAITIGRFGQPVFSQIRRFVIMRVKKKEHFVYACPITTYSGRATTKYGCNPGEHTIVHFSGTRPQYVDGERGNGMVKEPIEIEPAERGATMDPASRLRFGKTYPVEWNVKVKDIGLVTRSHMSKLIRYWKEEDFKDSDGSDGGE